MHSSKRWYVGVSQDGKTLNGQNYVQSLIVHQDNKARNYQKTPQLKALSLILTKGLGSGSETLIRTSPVQT